MANTEQIEAKLCAYVDGELDAAGRAEIEAHLQANPQHRQLLDELMRQRDLVRGLPRAKAPEDLFDSFQTQLERSVLLDHREEEPPAVAGRINRSSQWMAIAAVLAMAIGLAAVIYLVVLPRHQPGGDYAAMTRRANTGTQPTTVESETMPLAAPTTSMTIATATPAPEAPAAPGAPAAPATPSPVAAAAAPPPPPVASVAPSASAAPVAESVADARNRNLSKGGELALKTGAAEKVAQDVNIPRSKAEAIAMNQSGKLGKNAADVFAQNAQQNLQNITSNVLDAETAQRVLNSPAVPDNSALFVVASADPNVSNKQLTDYLAQNNLRWENVSDPMPTPAQIRNDDAMLRKMQQAPRMAMKESAPTGAGAAAPASQPADAVVGSRSAMRGGGYDLKGGGYAMRDKAKDVDAVSGTTTQPSAAAGGGSLGVGAGAGFGGSQGAGAVAPSAAPAPAAPPTTQPTQIAQAEEQKKLADESQQQKQQAERPRDQLSLKPTSPEEAARQQQSMQQQQQLGTSQQPQLIVVRGLTPNQFAELTACIGTQNNGQVAQYVRNGANIAPATQPAALAGDQSLALNTQVQVQVQAKAPSMPPPPSTMPAAGPVGADGQIRTPTSESATQPARDTSSITGQSSNATTQPLTPLPVPSQVAEQRLTAAAGATTQPAGAAASTPPQQTLAGTQPVMNEARIDAIIVLKPQDAAAVQTIAGQPAPNAAQAAPVTDQAAPNAAQAAPNAATTEQPTTSPAAVRSPASQP